MNCTIRAPGKLVITGEHAVVYGKSALVASINLYLYLRFETNRSGIVNFKFCRDSEHKYSLLLNSITKDSFLYYCHGDSPVLISRNSIEALFKLISKSLSSSSITPHIRAIGVICVGLMMALDFDYLCNFGINIEIDSSIPLSSGLGSSAAFSSCLAYMVLTLKNQKILEMTPNVLPIINTWALCFEKIFHGKPSGMDNTCIVYGGLMSYCNQQFVKLDFRIIEYLRFLVIHTGRKSNTYQAVKAIQERRKNHLDEVERIFEKINHVTSQFIYFLKNTDCDDHERYMKLKNLLKINEDHLRELELECSENIRIEQICQNFGFTSKITGAGKGGSTFVMYHNETECANVVKLKEELNENGFKYVDVEITKAGIMLV